MEVTISHNVALKGVKLKDTTALRVACEELVKEGAKLTLDLNAKTFRTYQGQSNKCDAAIIMGNGQHDIGLKMQTDGSYEPVFDPYGFSNDLRVGSKAENFSAPSTEGHRYGAYDQSHATSAIGKLLQRYGVVVTERAAAASGKTYTRQTNKQTGVVELTISG